MDSTFDTKYKCTGLMIYSHQMKVWLRRYFFSSFPVYLTTLRVMIPCELYLLAVVTEVMKRMAVIIQFLHVRSSRSSVIGGGGGCTDDVGEDGDGGHTDGVIDESCKYGHSYSFLRLKVLHRVHPLNVDQKKDKKDGADRLELAPVALSSGVGFAPSISLNLGAEGVSLGASVPTELQGGGRSDASTVIYIYI